MSRRRKFLTAAGIILGVVILIPVIRHYQLRFAVESYIAELKAKGEPMDLAQVIPPPVPPEKNGVPLIINALTNLDLTIEYHNVDIVQTNPPQAMQMIAPGKAMIGWQQPMIIGDRGIAEPSATNTWQALGQELTSVKSDLDSFQSLTNHPILDFKLDYQNLKLPHTGWLKLSAQWLSAEALYNLHQGNPKGACTDVRAMLAIVKGETDERPASSQLVRIAIAAIGANATWEILQNPNVSDDDLMQLQQDWQSLEFAPPFEQSLRFEQTAMEQEFKQARKSSEKFNELWGYFYAPDAPKPDISQFGIPIRRSLILRIWDEIRWRWFWSYQDELRGLQAYQVVIIAMRMAETNKTFQSVESFSNENLTQLKFRQGFWGDLRNFFAQSALSLNAARRKVTRMETARNIVITAIALKRYELRHQKLPATLDPLTPGLLQAIPIDCRDDQPLRYRQNADGTFLLYSVGENGADDGGDPTVGKDFPSSNFSWQNERALDWVWPQPATPAEVQFFYDHPPK